MSDKRNWQGEKITVNEDPQSVIKVWQIEPHLNGEYDSAVVRGYQDALIYAKDVVEYVMDEYEDICNYDIDELGKGQIVKISLIEMILEDYEGFQDDD